MFVVGNLLSFKPEKKYVEQTVIFFTQIYFETAKSNFKWTQDRKFIYSDFQWLYTYV